MPVDRRLVTLVAEDGEQHDALFEIDERAARAHRRRTGRRTALVHIHGIMGNFLERSLQFFLDQQQQFRGTVGSLVGQAPWALLNQLAERNMDLWKSFQQGLLNSASNAATPGAPKPKTPPKSGTR